MLAEATQEALDRHGWSVRAAQIYTGVNYNAVDRMRNGITTTAENLIRFALRSAEQGKELETVKRFLSAAGYTTFNELLELIFQMAKNIPEEQVQEVTLQSGQKVRILATLDGPGTTFEATPQNLALIENEIRLTKRQNKRDEQAN